LLGEREAAAPRYDHATVQAARGGGQTARDRPADVRHSYATAGHNAKIDWKALSQRIGHADVAFTMKQYVQTDLEADRQVANTLAELIVGGALLSTGITDRTARGGGR
jgi:integrase